MKRLSQIVLGAVWLLFNGEMLWLSSVTASIPESSTRQIQSGADWNAIVSDPPPTGLGPRNPCGGEIVPLIPIVKDGEKIYFGGYTSNAAPSFRYYVPYDAQAIQAATFFLRYRGGRVDYETQVTIVNAGIIKISLPANQKLVPEQWYEAELQVTAACRDDAPAQNVAASLGVKQKALSNSVGTSLPPQQQIEFYKKQQLWFEALEVGIKLECQTPNHLEWEKLLRSAGLENLVGKPIREDCTPPQGEGPR